MSTVNDFDFLHGSWKVRHRRLSKRGAGSAQWDEFDGAAETRPLLGGLCNVEEHDIPGQGFSGVAFRTFDRSTRLWSIAWVSASDGLLQPPVVGSFAGDIGRFEGEDRDGDARIVVRFLWDRSNQDAPRWMQSFSYDAGETWELNWVMQFVRA